MTASMIAVSLFVSCQKEKMTPEPVVKNEAISFSLAEAEPAPTKANNQQKTLFNAVIFDKDSTKVFLTAEESNYYANLDAHYTYKTKGAPFNSEDNPINSLHVTSFEYPYTTPFFSLDLSRDGNDIVDTGYYWPITSQKTMLSFFSYAKSNSNGILKFEEQESAPVYVLADGSDTDGWASLSGTFWYQLPAPDADEVRNDFQNSSDLAFAIAANKTNNGEPVNLDFFHALCAVVFKVGSIPSDMRIESISFKNVYSSGSCEYIHTNAGVEFIWTFTEGKDLTADYTQTFSRQLNDDEGNSLEDGTLISNRDETFMMIPQTFGETAEIEIIISFEDRKYTIAKHLKDLMLKWKPGKQYAFKISAPGEVKIEVADEVIFNGSYPVKQNLKIKNTGLADSYIKVAVEGNWVTDERFIGKDEIVQVIVSNWKNTGDTNKDDGFFDWGTSKPAVGTTNPKNWRLGTDGFYYYMKKVKPGEIIEPLFESYTLTASPPMVGAYLNLYIIAQGVLCSDVEYAFPAEIVDELEK